MALTSRTKLGPYEIVAPLGAGGMGEVYQAHDTKLGRNVAIKVLPETFANDPERLARFQREAKMLAALNHPCIATIHGLEQFGDTGYLVMELVPGETLAELVKREGAVPVEEALAIAKQIAEALEAAHGKGIIHRDLKPANVKLTPEGKVKVLDFGLAKAFEGDAGTEDLGSSPTLSRAATLQGLILGTAAYMSPEQARGKAVDKRTDIWAFGCVLYELLAGKQTFQGDDVTEILASVVKSEPDWVALSPKIPTSIRTLLSRCLRKDRRQRIADASDVRIEIEDAIAAPKDPVPTPAVPAPMSKLLLALTAALVIIAVVAVAFGIVAYRSKPPADLQKATVRFAIPLPPGQEITSYPAITRDGRTLAYVAQQGAEDSQLYLRDLNSFEPRAVPGSAGARQPFFSPDGKWVAFFAQGQLQKAEVAGGAPIRLAEAVYPFGGTWNEDNTIIYAASLGSGLLRIPASGGAPEFLTKPDGAAQGYAHVFPQALPGGKNVLFTIWGQPLGAAVLSLDSRRWDLVLPETGFAVPTFEATGGSVGRLLLVDQAAEIRAAPFDAAHPAPTTADISVLSNVYYEVETESLGWLAVSNTGTAVYATGNPARTELVWVDREGKIESLGKDKDPYREASLSPDGVKAVVRNGVDLWIHDLQRGSRSRVTTPANTANNLPIWSADGKQIIFASNRGGDWDIYSQPADGSRPAEALLKRPYDQFPLSVLADGTLLYVEIRANTGRDLWILSPDGKTSPFRATPFNETQGQFSPGPDSRSRWVAYASDESGQNEIYVESYPGGGHRILVSTGGGILPRWSRDGKELFYVTGDAVVAVAMRPDGSFGAARRLFDRSNFLFNHRFNSYSVSPDGKRFLMIQRDPASVPRQLNVILNWSNELDRPAAAGTK
jgi:serine/threonine protein kinase/Tol biopolymer transport system component